MRTAHFICYSAAVIGLIMFSKPASATPYNMYCIAKGMHARVVVGPFIIDPSASAQTQDEFIAWAKQLPGMTYPNAFCQVARTPEEAAVIVSDAKKNGFQYVADWYPSSVKAMPLQSAAHAIALDFEPGDGSGFLHAKRGYKRASIKLNYRFLLCANEIQVAYALDRKSLEHSQDYVDKFVGTNPNVITPPGEPPVPMTVPIALKVYLKKPGSPYVATLRDGTAGEALGMGCFTGQTSKIGLVAKLIGPKATRPEIKSYLDLLDLSGMTTSAEIDTPLLNPAVPAPPAPAPRPAVRRKAK